MRRRTCREYDAHPFRGPGMMRSLGTAGCVVAVLLTSGCVTTGPLEWIQNGLKVGPNYCRPPAPLAPEWIEANDAKVQSRQLQDWWGVFGDPTLNALIETAYDQNLTLRVVGTRVLQARAQQAIAVGTLFPQTQQATGSYSRVNLSHNAFNNPSAFASTSPFPTPPGAPIGNFYSDWTAGFNLSWELDFWGRFRRAIESSNANLDSSVENFDGAAKAAPEIELPAQVEAGRPVGIEVADQRRGRGSGRQERRRIIESGVAETDAAVLALRLLQLREDTAGGDGLLRPRFEDVRAGHAQIQVLLISRGNHGVEGWILKDAPPVGILQVAALHVGIAGLDPVVGHGRRGPAIIGTDLEAVANVVQRTRADAAAMEQHGAGQSGP